MWHRISGTSNRLVRRRSPVKGLVVAAVFLLGIPTATADPPSKPQLEPDSAPDRQSDGPGVPPPIVWPTPPLGRGPFPLESAEERSLRAVVVARGLQQPWSMAFLPDGNVLITERPGRLRIVRAGKLDPNPIAGVPEVRAQDYRA